MRYYDREHECTTSTGKKGNTCLAESIKKYSKLPPVLLSQGQAGSRVPEGCATSENLICPNPRNTKARITSVFWLLPRSVLDYILHNTLRGYKQDVVYRAGWGLVLECL